MALSIALLLLKDKHIDISTLKSLFTQWYMNWAVTKLKLFVGTKEIWEQVYNVFT